MAFADMGQTAVINITDEMRLLFSIEEDRQCFIDVSKVLVVPIFQYGLEEKPKHVVGALVIYSSGENSVLERADRQRAAKQISQQLARLLNQDYWVS
jgi:hypothetical protein